jgi:hypothetical protein
VSRIFYSTQLQFAHGHGLAKLHGKTLLLTECPLAALCIEYTPEVGVSRIMTDVGKWRGMSVEEIRAADDYLLAHHGEMQ